MNNYHSYETQTDDYRKWDDQVCIDIEWQIIIYNNSKLRIICKSHD